MDEALLPSPPDAAAPPPLPPTPACEIVALRKRFGATVAVDGLNLRVPPGMLYAFLGPNGAGKTTSLRMLAGLLKPDYGTARINGHDVHADPVRAKQGLAYIPDDPALYAKLTPIEFLEYTAALWSVPHEQARARAEELLTKLGLAPRAADRIESFSRGMKQKVALASALVHAPSLLMLDEPLTGLDAAAARLVKDMLVEFVAGGGTVLLTTHILEVAERLAQRIGIIAKGRLLAEGTLEELRVQAAMPGATLEDVFLRLVGSTEGMGRT
ncbi:MAG: ABC transporter ATP-binding protein [Opitutaceae bacterium]|nr:ABC transporter ATP-binding protein [Opitutaceae bacterium]